MVQTIFVILIVAIMIGMVSAAGLIPHIDTPAVVNSVRTTQPFVTPKPDIQTDSYGVKCDITTWKYNGTGWTCP